MNKDINIKALKPQVLNIGLILLFLLVGSRLYKAQINKAALLSEQKQKEASKAEVLAEIGRNEKAAKEYDKFFGRKDISSMINAINTAGKGLGIKVNSIKPQKEGSYSDYIFKYTFRVELSADNYHAVGKFIQQLETYPEAYYAVDSLKIKLPVSREKNVTYKLDAYLTVSGFALKD